jgi:hypothetical protein
LRSLALEWILGIPVADHVNLAMREGSNNAVDEAEKLDGQTFAPVVRCACGGITYGTFKTNQHGNFSTATRSIATG